MKIKAIHTAWDNKPCIVKPRFFPKETGLQFTVIEGGYSGSYFACKYEHFTFNCYAKFQIFFVRIWYYLKMNLWRKIYRQYPYKIKRLFKPIKTDVMCSALIQAFNDGRIQIEISGCKYENWLSLEVYVDGKYVHHSSGVLY